MGETAGPNPSPAVSSEEDVLKHVGIGTPPSMCTTVWCMLGAIPVDIPDGVLPVTISGFQTPQWLTHWARHGQCVKAPHSPVACWGCAHLSCQLPPQQSARPAPCVKMCSQEKLGHVHWSQAAQPWSHVGQGPYLQDDFSWSNLMSQNLLQTRIQNSGAKERKHDEETLVLPCRGWCTRWRYCWLHGSYTTGLTCGCVQYPS